MIRTSLAISQQTANTITERVIAVERNENTTLGVRDHRRWGGRAERSAGTEPCTPAPRWPSRSDQSPRYTGPDTELDTVELADGTLLECGGILVATTLH